VAHQSYYLESFILVMAAATFATRIVPFVFFTKLKDNQSLSFVGRYLPLMVMPILVVYSLKDTPLSPLSSAIPEVVSVVTVIAIHLWRSNALLSIGIGTAVYVLLKHYGASLPF
jgi:branched-subunit amino acid transport protein AzlD